MSDEANVLVTRPIMDEPLARLRQRCDVTVHENDFGIPREELLEVVKGRDAIVTMLTEKVDAEFLAAAGRRRRPRVEHARRAHRDDRRHGLRLVAHRRSPRG
jgi:hypothetical protein